MNELAEPAPSVPLPEPPDEWTQIFDGLRQRFPDASDGVLFCLHKLQQNADLKLRDFKDEAALHRVPLSGRSFHSARVMLGLEKPTPPRSRKSAEPPPADGDGLAELTQALAKGGRSAEEESPLIAALRRFQEQNAAELERMRAGVRAALAVIDAALNGEADADA